MKKMIVSAFVLVLGTFGCANTAGNGDTGGGGSSSTGTSSNSGGDACTPGDSHGCVCDDGRNGAQVCDDDGSGYGACHCSGSSTTGPSTSSSTGGGSGGSSGDSCTLRTFYPHWRPGDPSLVFDGQEVKFHFWGSGNGDLYCSGYIQDPSQTVENQNYTCLLQLCDGAPVTFDVEYQRQGSPSTQFVFDLCSFPGSDDWCDSQGQGVNCANIVGASNAVAWVSKDDPNNAGFWVEGNGSTQNTGSWNSTPDNLACTRDGTFTVPSN